MRDLNLPEEETVRKKKKMPEMFVIEESSEFLSEERTLDEYYRLNTKEELAIELNTSKKV